MAEDKKTEKIEEVAEVKKTKKESKKAVKKVAINKSYSITKSNGNVIYRSMMGDLSLKNYKAKGWKVEEV
tara:strand:+ start:284 stop:493 length:210 start_codon:yes stop_codon:yes gene_type:complete